MVAALLLPFIRMLVLLVLVTGGAGKNNVAAGKSGKGRKRIHHITVQSALPGEGHYQHLLLLLLVLLWFCFPGVYPI